MAKFKTRARTVDMLGRQQIAGIPTAISELFKNAHDAYADNAIVDFFRTDQLLVLRDDGLGMSEQDFETRWLTLGTDSKVSGTTGSSRRPGYDVRAILGEKGIGRLAIAAIGPQVLILSRSYQQDQLGDLLISFLNWGLFELPSVNLEEIEIPTITVPGGTLPSNRDIRVLIDWVSDNLHAIAKDSDDILVRRIESELKSFEMLDIASLTPTLGTPNLVDGSGTHFYIQPASEVLTSELEESSDPQASPLRRLLVGFANTMTPEHASPLLHTSFRYHPTDDASFDVIGESEFFTPEEFTSADHHIRGSFDEYGQFKGVVSVYGSQPEEYIVGWKPASGAPTRCGPFEFSLAYVQGRRHESRLASESWSALSQKLNQYGGLYIYRDGIRVLPYGSNDFDFLDIEVQRAKSAADAFFSYRRMIGAIEITRTNNSNLREKAGREGFADNLAYRQFREILKNFLYQVALDYFRDTGSQSETYTSTRSELQRIEKARQQRSRTTKERRSELSASLASFFTAVDAQQPEEEVDQILSNLKEQLKSAEQVLHPGQAVAAIIKVESEAREGLQDLSQKYSIRRPRGVGLSQTQAKSWLGYERERERLAQQVFASALNDIEVTLESAAQQRRVQIDRRLRLEHALTATSERARNSIRQARQKLERSSGTAASSAKSLNRKSNSELELLIQRLISSAARLDTATLGEEEFLTTRAWFETQILETSDKWEHAIEGLAQQFSEIVLQVEDPDDIALTLDSVEALETDLQALRERADSDLALVQLGAAISVINHEFEGTINAIRRNLRRMKSWADVNPDLRAPYRDLRASFEHLDGYLRLFTPFQRRLYRSPITIAGSDIEAFLRDVFGGKLNSSNITLSSTREFLDSKIIQYPSVIYPVFINLVDNAIFWLTDFRGLRAITLDCRGESLIVSDSGPGISHRDRDTIFDYGFSRKPGGSGYGLAIAREALRKEGWDLELGPPNSERGAEFVIRDISRDEEIS